MDVRLVPSPDPAVAEAARRAVAVLESARAPAVGRGRWWIAGVEEGLAARAVLPGRAERYDVAPSPRSTRGATRA
jgi:hypothetical protein